MNKLRILAQKCAALLLLLHCLVAAAVHLLREKVQQQCISFSSMIRRISRLKPATYSASQCSSSNTFPNFAQELLFSEFELHRKVVEELEKEDYGRIPVNDEFADYVPENDGASVYAMDEYDEDDFEEWYGSEADWDWDYDQYGRIVFFERFVDDIIADEEPGAYPPGATGDIPF